MTMPTLPTLPTLRSRDWMGWATGLHAVAGWLQTTVTGMQTTDTGLQTSVTALQASVAALQPTTWQAMPLVISATGFATGHDVMYRSEGSRVWGKGWASTGTSGLAGTASLLSAPLPAAYRPAQARELWPIGTSTNRPYRVILNTDGTMAAADAALPAGTFLNFDRVTWPLG